MGSLELTQEGTPFAHEPIGNTRKRVREHAVRLWNVVACSSDAGSAAALHEHSSLTDFLSTAKTGDDDEAQSPESRHDLHTASRRIIDVLVEEGIGTLILIGKNPFWKQGVALGRKHILC